MRVQEFKTNKERVIEELQQIGFENYYLQIFDESVDLEVRAELLLKLIGVKSGLCGFEYTKDALIEIYDKKSVAVAMFLYEKIAQKYDGKTAAQVERGIRHSKELVFKTDFNLGLRKLIFGDIPSSENMNYIYSLKYFMKSFKI